MAARVVLPEVDRVEILSVIDLSLDLLMAGSDTVRRAASFLFAAGLTRDGLLHDMDVLELRPADLQAVVLSHGHADHVAGLVGPRSGAPPCCWWSSPAAAMPASSTRCAMPWPSRSPPR